MLRSSIYSWKGLTDLGSEGAYQLPSVLPLKPLTLDKYTSKASLQLTSSDQQNTFSF